jgi:hypothetical protein
LPSSISIAFGSANLTAIEGGFEFVEKRAVFG